MFIKDVDMEKFSYISLPKFLIEKKRKELEIRLYREYFIPFVRNINLNKYQYKSAC